MANLSSDLDRAFAALADPTRRAIIGTLCTGPRTVSEMSGSSGMSLPSFLKHLKVLERSGLISSEKAGRVRTCRIKPEALRATEEWIERHVRLWDRQLDRLEAHVQKMKRMN